MFPFIQVPKSFNSKTETGACLINNLSGKLRLFGLFWVTFCLFFFFLGSFQLQQQRLYLCPNSSHLLTGLSGRPLFKRVSCYNKSRVAFLLLFQLFSVRGLYYKKNYRIFFTYKGEKPEFLKSCNIQYVFPKVRRNDC